MIAQTLERRVKDPRLGFLTLTEVRLSGDNCEATVFYTVLGDDAERAGTAAALDWRDRHAPHRRRQQLGIKFAPTLAFVLDATLESAKQIEDLLAQVQAADAAAAASAVGKEFAGRGGPVPQAA